MLRADIIKYLFLSSRRQTIRLGVFRKPAFSATLIIFNKNSGRVLIAAWKSLLFGEWNIDGLMQ